MPKPNEPLFHNDQDKETRNTNESQTIAKHINRLVAEQPFGILCTQGQNQPYGSVIAFAFKDDLKRFYFTTSVATRKFRLLTECKNIALVIDNRCQYQDDMTKIEGITVTGKAKQLKADENEYISGTKLLESRHHYLHSFIDSPSTVLFRVDVHRFFYVTRFQEVHEWIPW
jgi:nitroimidazol reductase NimA-like FMN-containing flavoprotein (pyridoxamine 5'-phosphate oxidase superfamily)